MIQASCANARWPAPPSSRTWQASSSTNGSTGTTKKLRIYYPGREVEQESTVQVGTGPKSFYCIAPLTENEVPKLAQDFEEIVICPEHLPTDNCADCANCHARKLKLIERAIPACERVEDIKTRGVKKVLGPLTSAKQTSLFDCVSPVSKKIWPLPDMVGFGGLRMEIPRPDSPFARWRLNLR